VRGFNLEAIKAELKRKEQELADLNEDTERKNQANQDHKNQIQKMRDEAANLELTNPDCLETTNRCSELEKELDRARK
jgi:translation elongation factor EF-1alpha